MIQRQWQHNESDQNQNGWPFVSVIVPVRNESASIRHTLRQLLDQRYPADSFEVIVADGESTDNTQSIVHEMEEDYPNLQLVNNPGIWSSAGRNAAIEVAIGDIVLLVDGHCDLDNPEYLLDLVDAFVRSGADCIGRPQPLDISQANPVQQAIGLARSSRLGHHPDSWIYADTEAYVSPQSVAIAYKRDIFDKIGTFDETFDACEDVEFNHRVDKEGYTCFFTPKSQVKYHPRSNLRGLFRQMMRYGRGRVRLLKKHPDTFSVPGFIPALFVLGLVTGPLLGLFSSWCMQAYVITLMAYGAIVALFSVGLAVKERRWNLLPYFPLVYVTVHLGAGSGVMLEFLLPVKRPERSQPVTIPLENNTAEQPRKAA